MLSTQIIPQSYKINLKQEKPISNDMILCQIIYGKATPCSPAATVLAVNYYSNHTENKLIGCCVCRCWAISQTTIQLSRR